MKKLFVILGFLIPLGSQAQDAFYASGLLGINRTTVDIKGVYPSFDPEITFGFRFGLLFNDHISAGVYLQRYSGSGTSSDKDNSFKNRIDATDLSLDGTFNNFLAEITYYVNEADENSFWISGLLGVTQVKLSGFSEERRLWGSSPVFVPHREEIEKEKNETAFGAALGYHFMVAPNFSISPQVTFVYTDTDDGKYTQFSGLLNITLWL